LQEMLPEGIVILSTSPFSSLMFLVKRKDEPWWFEPMITHLMHYQ